MNLSALQRDMPFQLMHSFHEHTFLSGNNLLEISLEDFLLPLISLNFLHTDILLANGYSAEQKTASILP